MSDDTTILGGLDVRAHVLQRKECGEVLIGELLHDPSSTTSSFIALRPLMRQSCSHKLIIQAASSLCSRSILIQKSRIILGIRRISLRAFISLKLGVRSQHIDISFNNKLPRLHPGMLRQELQALLLLPDPA